MPIVAARTSYHRVLFQWFGCIYPFDRGRSRGKHPQENLRRDRGRPNKREKRWQRMHLQSSQSNNVGQQNSPGQYAIGME